MLALAAGFARHAAAVPVAVGRVCRSDSGSQLGRRGRLPGAGVRLQVDLKKGKEEAVSMERMLWVAIAAVIVVYAIAEAVVRY